jgi:hypothetical protein
MPLPRQALATLLLAAASAAAAAPPSAPAAEVWQGYPQQYPLPQFVGDGPAAEPSRGAQSAPAARALDPARASLAAPGAARGAPRCPPGLEPGALRPKAGLRAVPDLSARVTSWNLDWSQGCFSPEASGYRRAVLADGRAGHVKDELVEAGPDSPEAAAGLAAAATASAYPLPPAPSALAPAALEPPPSARPQFGSAAVGAQAPAPAAYQASAPAYPQPPAPERPRLELSRAGPGLGVSVEKTHDSDRIRQAWAARGGNIGAVELSGGASFMYKFTEVPRVMEMTMTGAGFSLSTRFSRLVFSPPQYERDDRSWGAFKIGGGTDLAFFSVTNEFRQCYVNGCSVSSTTSTSSMQSFSLVGTLGFTRAFGRFTSPTKWSGVSLGIEWAPSYTMTSTSSDAGGGGAAGGETTSSAFNATGFAISLEGGSLEALTAKLAKKAHLKFRFFMLPPVGDLPLFVNFSAGAVMY